MAKIIESVVSNYRQMYKARYGTIFVQSDDIIWEIFNTVFNDEDNKQQDIDRVEEMRRREGHE